MSGWKFGDLHIRVRQRLCEALYAAGRKMDASESLLELVNTFDEEVNASMPVTKWVSDFTKQCLSTIENDNDAVSNATSTPFLRQSAQSTLASAAWRDVMVASASFICEHLESMDRMTDAVECFHEMTNDLGEEVYASGPTNFMQRQLSTPRRDQAESSTRHTMLTLLLRDWVKAKLTRVSWKDALVSAIGFELPRVAVYQTICECLKMNDRITDAVECFHQMISELGEANLKEHMEWARDLSQYSSEKLEHLGDTAMDAQRHDKAISYYTTALSLSLACLQGILIRRSKAWLATGSWENARDDADRVIVFDPLSPWGDYDNAVATFEMMLSKMTKSPNLDIQLHSGKYISPSSTRATIQKIVQKIIPHLPRVLINVETGHLYDRAAHAALFESSPIFKELVSSMTIRKDYVRIKREVRQYFRYVMFSHKWEDNEPLFQKVVHMSVYDLEQSPTHDKLKTFCKIAQGGGFNWAWSDTCCINKADHFVLQEALVAMFKWYEGCAIMIVFLRGAFSSSLLGALVQSIWNTRAWTLQEYIAAKVIHFYTEDWTPYLHLDIPNHKLSPQVISEMEEATGISALQLMALRPGYSSIREKLRLASTRKTTLVEDAAYSLLGIFSVTGIPAIYGEGEGSLGRMLSHVLAGSGDSSILAWTGESGSFNSCLPASIAVFNESLMSHLLAPVPDDEMGRMITTSQSSSFDLDVALSLYDRLNELSPPWFSGQRMKLPCIAFQLSSFSRYRTRSGRTVYRADTTTFGMMEIKTKNDLSRMKTLYLVHPWFDTLLEREDTRSITTGEHATPLPSLDADDEEISDEEVIDEQDISGEEEEEFVSDSPWLPQPELPSSAPPMDRETRARRLVAHLRQLFGAILLGLTPSGVQTDYKRVAADTLIRVQFEVNVSLTDILDNVRTLDVL
ncbi:hypothetical protein V8E55_006444 [Tylopilus felleus]